MRTWQRWTATAAFAVTAASTVVIGAGPAQAATRLGGISVERECQDQDGYHARIKTWSAFGWVCNPFSAPVPCV